MHKNINSNFSAYTYSIKFFITGQIYYGCRKSNTFDLGIKYFSSSKKVKNLIKKYGIEQFEFKIRRLFYTYKEAREHEFKVLTRLNATKNINMLNLAISSPKNCIEDIDVEYKRRKAISDAMKAKWKDPEFIEKQNNSNSVITHSKNQKSNYGKKGSSSLKQKYKKGYKRGTIKKENIKIKKIQIIFKIREKQLAIKKRETFYNNKKQKNRELQSDYIQKVLESDIDFSKFGWVKQVSLLLNKKPQKIKKWMTKYMNDFYQNNCFKRKQ